MLPALIRLARPTHWVKNGFVAGPLIFANPQSLGVAVVQSATAVAVFSLMASAIYCFNDVIDAESDRAHPTKRTRPIAAGLVTPQLGVAWGAVLAAAAIALAWFRLPPAVLAVLGAYVINNVLYNAQIIFSDIEQAIKSWKTHDYFKFGHVLGDALVTIVGQPEAAKPVAI